MKRYRKPKKRYQKGDLSRKLVIYCITILTIAVLWAMATKTYCAIHSVDMDVSDVLTFIGAAFGGELLLLLLKRVLSKPREETNEDE